MLSRRTAPKLHESPAIWLPEYSVTEARPTNLASVAVIGFALARELSGKSELERAQTANANCSCATGQVDLLGSKKTNCGKTSEELYLEMTERKFNGIKRCC